jgi:lysozyme family protein
VNSSWPFSLIFVWRPENDGQALHTDTNDYGGATSMGVTHTTWAAAVEHGLVADVPLAEASQDDLALVLKTNFWNAAGCDRLAVGVDMAVFNLAMVGGPGRAARVLQSTVGAVVDGQVGPRTLAAAAKMSSDSLIRSFTASEETFYASIPSARFFLKGWDRRAEDCRTEALALLATA